MNDQIGKLCEQSKLYADNCTKDFTGDEPVVWMDYYTEKFAELIVQVAAAFVSGAAEVYNQVEQDACVRASKGLKKYFGVE